MAMRRSLKLIALAAAAILPAAVLAFAEPRVPAPSIFAAPPSWLPSKGCKYKTDGTGNCLSPAFYKCQKEWAKCSEACKGDMKCLDKCEVKFAPQCGD